MHSLEDPELRKKFTGQPEHLINFLFMVAEDTDVTATAIAFLAQLNGQSAGSPRDHGIVGYQEVHRSHWSHRLAEAGKAWEEVCKDFERISYYAFGFQSSWISLTESLYDFLLLAGLVPV